MRPSDQTPSRRLSQRLNLHGQVTRRRLLGGISGIVGGLTVSSLLASCGGTQAKSGGSAPTSSATSPSAVTASPSAPSSSAVAKIRFAWWTDVGTLSPFQFSTTGPGGVVLLSFVFDTLTWKDDKQIIPWLGTRWETAPDGKSYSFAIASDATWHDGQSLTPDDVAFSFGYFKDHPFKWMSSDVVESTEAGADGTVKFTLAHPAANFLEEIAGIVPVIPKHVWASVPDATKFSDSSAMIGSGPYVVTEHDATAGAYRLTAYDTYFRGTPRVAEVQQITIPAQTELQQVQNGDVDLSQSTDASIVGLLANDAQLKVAVTEPLSVVRMAVNTQSAPLDRKEVRQAIMYALNREQIAKTITKGPAIVNGVAIVPPGTPWFNPNVTQYPYDPEKARSLLNGEKISVDLLADPTAREPELMAPMLEAVGITLNVKQVDVATRLQLLSDGSFQLALTGHIGIGGDPDYLRRWYAGEEANAFAKGSIFKNAEYAQLGEQELAELDPEKRKAIVFRMQQILADELPTLILYHRNFYWIYNADFFTPMETWGGLMNGIPFPNNKLTLLRS